MEKKKIIIGVAIAIIAIIGIIILINALSAPDSIEMDGQSWYVGDIIHTANKTEGSKGMIITQINHEDNSFISESLNGDYKMRWDTTIGLGKWLVKDGQVNPYA
ncbi:MAG: hypothetical protein FWE58_04580 [Methanobrevibacter sp.]|nr:hypothetical protein [Methanobrevibacter sp.]